jgi:phenylalanyl-tRNA synthetase alpha chain
MSTQLPESHVAVLTAASATDADPIESLARSAEVSPETASQAAFELANEGFVELTEEHTVEYGITDEGHTYIDRGLPERRLYDTAVELGQDDIPLGDVIEHTELSGQEVDIALANFTRKELGEIESGNLHPNSDAPSPDPEQEALAAVAHERPLAEFDTETLERLLERNLLEATEQTTRKITLTDAGVTTLMEGVEVADTVDRITPEMLTSGEWRDVEFSEYNVEADAPSITAGKPHVLRHTAERVKDVLVGMGFTEMTGPHADADFWINDCLFMPQDHPARTHWDRFALDVDPMDEIPTDLLERVENAHREGVGSDGDGYHSPWSGDFARAVALRGHTTSLSMRYLSGIEVGRLSPPQRYFSVEKVYRNDTLDSTHLLEFFQIEGWVMAEDLSVRDLMGTFVEFYEQFGITDIQFKPHYNPYTEPSFELFGRHPTTDELIEIGNSGMFREEVLTPLGVECDVMAWGLALERLAMLTTGAEDIRDLHGTLADIQFLRDAEVSY